MLITRWILRWLQQKNYIPYCSAEFTPEMLDAVIRHELGHCVYNHYYKSIIGKGSLLAGLFLLVNSSSEKVFGLFFLPAVVIVDRYISRLFEREADQFAITILDEEGIKALHDFFEKTELLESNFPKDNFDRKIQQLISTHPSPEERMEYLKKAYEERLKTELMEKK